MDGGERVLPEKSYEDVYGEKFESWGPSDYYPILNSFGVEIILQVDEEDYEGDSWVLYKDGDAYGFLCFGWGSCSGCDSLQACDTEEEVLSLRSGLFNSIIWFDSASDVLDYINSEARDGDYYGRSSYWEVFKREANNIF